MKINVKVEEEWFVIPCGSKKKEIRWLKEEAVKRFNKYSVSRSNTPLIFYSNECELRLTEAINGILDDDDTVQDVLNDKDFVVLVEKKEKVDQKSLKRKNPVSVQPHSGLQDSKESSMKYIAVDGCSLTTDDLVKLGTGKYSIKNAQAAQKSTLDPRVVSLLLCMIDEMPEKKLTEESRAMVNKGRQLLEDIIIENRVAYGVNTGFGKFAQVIIAKDKLTELQENLIRSHAIGTGDPLTVNRTRMLLALRINVLAKGYSGISESTLEQYIKAFNNSLLPMVPEQGTVGASGDLAPLSHLALGIALGEGKMWSPRSGWADASMVLEAHGMKPFSLKPKEGIALINGTQLITALGAEALERANAIAKQADIIAALSLEVLKGSTNAFDIDIQRVRPHKGQGIVAERLRSVLHSEIHPSEIAESHRFCNRVQDAYTLRCCPQVHGIVNDTIDFVRGILTTEMNSATDNPIVFADRGVIMSGGNFHGEYPAKALDYLAIGIHELASMSERRMERLMNPAYSELPAFLCKDGGLNSGFMMMHCTAASLVSENKVLCHPSSVDSLSTSAGQEDHVSMGGFSARKALKVVENVEKVLAIELLCACQGIEFLRPLKTTQPLESVYALVRSVAKPLDKDRYMVPDMKAVTGLLLQEKVWESAFPFYRKYQHQSSMDEHEDQIFKSPSTSVMSSDDNVVNKKRKADSDTVVKTCY